MVTWDDLELRTRGRISSLWRKATRNAPTTVFRSALCTCWMLRRNRVRFVKPREDPSLKDVLIHPSALVETDQIGAGTRIWAFVHVLPGARLGRNCSVGDHCFIESGTRIG